MLTRKAITKARRNASLTVHSRLIVESPVTGTFDVGDDEEVRETLRKRGIKILAEVSWDGEVTPIRARGRGTGGVKKKKKKRETG